MPLLDLQDVKDNLLEASEIPAAIQWAEHHKLQHNWDPENLIFKVFLSSANVDGGKEKYLLTGTFPDYRVIPPTWRFVDPRTEGHIGKAAYPQPGPFPGGSILHTNGVICAPWSRLAYGDKNGPHPEWQAGNWQTTAPDQTQALTIPDMLARIHVEVKLSPGRQAALPALPEEADA